jgi:hypothetical protein
MRFWLANLFERLWVVAVALAALLIPLSKIVPPIYVWRVRSRVYRWYGELRKVEQELEAIALDDREAARGGLLLRLDDIEERVNHISIPLAYAEELYRLRSHINFVRERVRGTIDQHGVAVPRKT